MRLPAAISPFSRRGTLGPTELLVLQPTPFCNLDCSYCYLANRSDRRRLSLDTLERIITRLLADGLVGERLSIVWHAGEPMVVGLAYYQQAFDLIDRLLGDPSRALHSFQTNGVLIDEAWCDFFKRRRVNVGISVDGPAFIHDRYRRTRTGGGTHQRVQRALDLLNREEVAFHTISVLTDIALSAAPAIYAFLIDNQVRRAAFNVEETEGVNRHSTLDASGTRAWVAEFFSKLQDLVEAGSQPIRIREIEGAVSAVLGWDPKYPRRFCDSQELTPYRIITVDADGNFSTFSPELLGVEVEGIGRFQFGNVESSGFLEAASTPKFLAVRRAINAGVDRCQRRCSYFELCGGGSPSNKYFEHGTFDCDQTNFCTLHKQTLLDVQLERMERTLELR